MEPTIAERVYLRETLKLRRWLSARGPTGKEQRQQDAEKESTSAASRSQHPRRLLSREGRRVLCRLHHCCLGFKPDGAKTLATAGGTLARSGISRVFGVAVRHSAAAAAAMVRLVNAGDEPDEAASSSERRDLVRRLAEEVEPFDHSIGHCTRRPSFGTRRRSRGCEVGLDAAAAAAERLRRLSPIVQSLSRRTASTATPEGRGSLGGPELVGEGFGTCRDRAEAPDRGTRRRRRRLHGGD